MMKFQELDTSVRLVHDLWNIAEGQPGHFRASVFEFRP
jgi:anaerobic magnesium-protoporphyrin IX monomethyl ester cyclase